MNESLAETLELADSLYRAREDLGKVRESVEPLSRSFPSGDYEAAWRLGRALFFLGQESGGEDERISFHTRGVKACERASQAQPRRVEAHFWLGVNLALLAQAEKTQGGVKSLTALRHALAARRALRRAARIDPAYHAAGPLRVLARLEQKLPKIFGGGHARARANFEGAVALAPSNTVTRIYFAEMLIEEGKRVEAVEQLREILSAAADPAWSFEIKRDKQQAQEMLRMMKEEK